MCDPVFAAIVTAVSGVSSANAAQKSARNQKRAMNEAAQVRKKEEQTLKKEADASRRKSDLDTLKARKEEYADRRVGTSNGTGTRTRGIFGARSFFG